MSARVLKFKYGRFVANGFSAEGFPPTFVNQRSTELPSPSDIRMRERARVG